MGPGFILPLICPLPMVVTIHDLTFELFPEVHETIKRFYFRAMIRSSQKGQAGFGDIENHDGGRTVCCPIVGKNRKRPCWRLVVWAVPKRHLQAHRSITLFLGTLEPRKNLKRLLAAWNGLGPEVRVGHDLVVVGATGWMIDELLVGAGERSDVVFAGQVTDVSNWLNG